MDNQNESLFLAFRRFFPPRPPALTPIDSESDIIDFLTERLKGAEGRVGILLSSGMDSAILAKFIPKGSVAYTIDYQSQYSRKSEFASAGQFVPSGVEHKRVVVERDRYFSAVDFLTEARQAPTVPHEATVYIAAQQARADGVDCLVGGFGADSRLGGFPGFYRERSFEGFKKELFRSYIDPQQVLVQPAPIDWVIHRYTTNGMVDVQRLLTEIGTEGTSARDAIELCGLKAVLPYTELVYTKPFDLELPAKYLVSGVFTKLYGFDPPHGKFALWVPYEDWLGGITIDRPEFLRGCTIEKPLIYGAPPRPISVVSRAARRAMRIVGKRLTTRRYFPAKKGYLLFSLEKYYHFKEKHGWTTPDPHG